MRIAKLCCFVLSLIFTIPAFSQTAGRSLDSNDPIISSETMHVHFDKDIYLPGETIWFKAYLYNINETSYSSTNFYVALYDEKGKLIEQKQYPVFEGSCNGDFVVPDTIESSRIQFRAFTKAMIINDSNNIYEKVLTVYNRENNADSIIANKTTDLRFFPEGGQVIAELQNYIAFKAVHADGRPAMIKGQIIQVQRNILIDTLDDFSTDNMGLGKLVLTALPYKNYIAVWKDESGTIRQTPLPAVSRFGVSFHAEIINKELQYTIARNRTCDSLSLLHLQAQMGNYRIYKADLVIPNEMELSTAKFPVDSVPTGLLQLTLFDKDWKPLQEKLVFVNNSPGIQQPLMITDTINTNAKAKNTIEITLPDTLFTNLSASVADINFYDQPRMHSINEDLWFNAQLKGLDQNLDPLLNSGNSNAIDLITLTHEWKRYSWQKALDKNMLRPEILDNYISLVINYREKNLVLPKDDALNLFIKNRNGGTRFYNLRPTDQTVFKKPDLVFFDSVKVSYQMNTNKGLVNYLTVSKDDTLKIPSSINALDGGNRLSVTKPFVRYNTMETFVTTRHSKFNDVQTIKGVVVKTRYINTEAARLDELDKFYTSGFFRGPRGFQLNVIDDSIAGANNNVQNYIRFRVPGLSLENGHLGILRKIESHNKRGEYVIKDTIFQPATFIDELRVESEELQSLSMWDVAYVKYIPGIVIGAGFRSLDGALYIYTKKGNEKGPPSKGLPFVYVKGYNSQKEFASPDYSDKTLLKEPDLRTTLYWNPNIIMDKTNNKVKIEFYNNDVSKKLLLTIEGVNEKGKLIHIEKIIE